jgi:hypothetical protein
MAAWDDDRVNALARATAATVARADDVAARRRALLGALLIFAERRFVINRCRWLIQTLGYREYAYRHTNGFHVVYLADPDAGIQVRLHVWTPQLEARKEEPHRHRMAFASRVLVGELRSILYEKVTSLQSGDKVFQEFCIDGADVSEFAAPDTRLLALCRVGLRERARLLFKQNESYFFSPDDIHRVETPAPLTDPIVTLTIWEAAYQPSLAYEPIDPAEPERSVRTKVARLEDYEFRRVVQTALDAMGAANELK